MIKRIFLTVLSVLLLLSSCAGNQAVVMPFEATFHKFVYILTKDLEEINLSDNSVLTENETFSVIFQNGCLSFFHKERNLYYDTFGNESTEIPETGLNISVAQGEDYKLEYKNGTYYNSETDNNINTFTAYKINDHTVRLLIVTGVDEFEVISKIPKVLQPSTVSANEKLKEFYSTDSAVKDKILEEFPILEERLTLTEDLYYLSSNISDSDLIDLGLTPNSARETALMLGYDFNQVKMILTTVDITLNDNSITFDISKNRQFRSELIRDKSFKHSIFEFEIDFINKTASESEKITDAQSKY